MGSISIQCPACLSKAKTKNFIELSPKLRELESACSNLKCGHTFVSRTEFTRTVHPSELPVDFQTEVLSMQMGRANPGQISIFEEDSTLSSMAATTSDRSRSGFKIKCHKCLSDATIYSSTGISPLLREHWCWCNNSSCGHTFVSHTAFYKSITPTMFKFAAAPHPDLLSVAATVVALPVPAVSTKKEEEDTPGRKMNWVDDAA